MRSTDSAGIALVPGDDSHGVAGVGLNLDRGVAVLRARGGSTDWRRPQPGRHVGA